MPKSPEALHIFFSGPVAGKLLQNESLTATQRQTIEQAILSAKSSRPDLDLLRRADAIIQNLHPNSSFHAEGQNQGESLQRLSHPLSQESRKKKRRFWQGSGRGLLDYLYWRWKWKTIYVPLLVLGTMLILLPIVRHSETVQKHLKASQIFSLAPVTYAQARKICLDVGKELPSDPQSLLPALNSLTPSQAELGYWLRDGRIYIPKSDQIVPKDQRYHWYLCIQE